MDIEFNSISVDISPLVWLTLIVFLILQWRRKQRKSYIFCLLIFGIYLFYTLQVTFFPMQINGGYADARKAVSTWTTDINLIPFYIPPGYFAKPDLIQFAIIQFVENILLTIPFGFGINFIARLRRKDFLWLPLALGFGIEITQLLFNLILRYPYRVVDLTDALLNAAGVLIGYALFRLFSGLYIAITPNLPASLTGLFAYIQDVASRA